MIKDLLVPSSFDLMIRKLEKKPKHQANTKPDIQMLFLFIGMVYLFSTKILQWEGRARSTFQCGADGDRLRSLGGRWELVHGVRLGVKHGSSLRWTNTPPPLNRIPSVPLIFDCNENRIVL